MTQYYCAQLEEMTITASLPVTALPFSEAILQVLPPQISELHQSLARWFGHGLSPDAVTPERIWIAESKDVYFAFATGQKPNQLMQTGLAVEIAAWLVLLDRWMETFVVVARARAVWSPDELAGALTFLTPAFLPSSIVNINPNWDQVAEALALAVADGPLAGTRPLAGTPNDRHWRSTKKQPDPGNPSAPETNPKKPG